MIDFFPEDSTQPPGNVRVNTGYCDLKAKTGSLSPGILDRHGKHFMLAQPEDKKLGDYAPSIGQQWVLAQVDYAGEILVRVNQNGCEYVLNNGSGTYGPNGKYLKDVAALFATSVHLGVAPVEIWDTTTKKVTSLQLLGSSSILGC